MFAILGWFSIDLHKTRSLISLWVSPFVKPKGITNQQFSIGTLYKKKMIDSNEMEGVAWMLTCIYS